MKILICNTPLRGEGARTIYPPLGPMAIIQWLRGAGFTDIEFYDLNYFRPSDESLAHYLLEHKFDVIGISASVSATYRDVKKYTAMAKSLLPGVVVIVGGALSFSPEVLLKLGKVDYCVVGEGELIAVNLMQHLARHDLGKDVKGLREIKGLSFLDEQGDVVFTGYERQLAAKEIPDPDYPLLRKYNVVDHYFPEPWVYEQFTYDERSHEPHRRGKRMACVVSSRGCIAHCTFCHRWQQGIRMFSVEGVIRLVRHVIDEYNVGFISFGDEDFGATKKWIAEFADRMKELGILYRLSAVRADNINLELLKRLRDSGCVAIHYGWESGSDRMLTVMEKMVNAETNYRVARWTEEAGLHTIPALVVGMPGESYQTIAETTRFVETVTENLPRQPAVSVNQLVVLPGTPVYEYARQRGFLGTTLEGEEAYLLQISNQDGGSPWNLNLTDYPTFVLSGWIHEIYWSVRYHYCKKNNLPRITTMAMFWRILKLLFIPSKKLKDEPPGIATHPLFYRLRHVIAPAYVAATTFREIGMREFLKRCVELIAWPLRKKFYTECLPVRKYLKSYIQQTLELGATNVQVLRLGR